VNGHLPESGGGKNQQPLRSLRRQDSSTFDEQSLLWILQVARRSTYIATTPFDW